MFYNSSDILLAIIIAFANEKKSILYITNEDVLKIDIIYFIDKFSNLDD